MGAYIARIREIARALDQSVERAQLAASEGVHAPRFSYDRGIASIARARITGAPFDGDGDSPL